MKKIALSLILLLVAAACYVWWNKTQASQQAPKYKTAVLTKGDVSSKVSATGTLQAVTRINVGSQLSGNINQVFVVHNSVVKRGDVLAQLDPSTFQTQVTQATASMNNVESSLSNAQADAGNAIANLKGTDAAIITALAQVDQAKVGVVNARASIGGSQARVRKAQATLDNAQANLSRMQDLADREIIADSELDTARANFLGAEADVDTAKADLLNAEANLSSAETTVRSAEAEVVSARIRKEAAQEQVTAAQARVGGFRAQVVQAQASLQSAQIDLQRTAIISPIDGVVLDVTVTEGMTVAAQLQTPNLFVLAESLAHMQVETSVDEADIGKVKSGAKATFTVDAFPDKQFDGTVTEVRQSPLLTNNVVTYVVIVQTQNPDLLLKPGMTATVDIIEESRKDVLLIPNEALRFTPPAGSVNRTRPSPTPGAVTATPAETRPRRERTGERPPTVYTLEGEQLKPHRLRVGVTDELNSEAVKTDLQEGDVVVVGQESPPDAAAPRSSPVPGRGGGRRGGMRMF